LIPENQLLNPDQRLFQTAHLITELAWCQMHFQLRRVIAELQNGEYVLAGRLLLRVAETGDLPVVATRVLLQALPQYGMLEMRSKFAANSSGLDSPGGRNLRVIAGAVWRAFEAAAEQEGIHLSRFAKNIARPLAQKPLTPEEAGLTTVYEGLHKVDSKVTEWRQVHMRLVWSQLGGHPGDEGCPQRETIRELPMSLRGRPITDLERMAERPLFPKLWTIISDAFKDMGGGVQPMASATKLIRSVERFIEPLPTKTLKRVIAKTMLTQSTEVLIRCMLGNTTVFSCAYFEDAKKTLEEAQDAKLDYVLRKLDLSKGERLLDVGCGWGALVLRAARYFGARATGLTISHSQLQEARNHIAAAKMKERAKVVLGDFVNIERRGRFDKIASVAMFEHVGRNNLRQYFKNVYDLLRPGGLFLNHGMAYQNHSAHGERSQTRRPFPGTELVTLPETLAIATDAGFEIRDVENLREHYVRTFAWSENLKKHRDKIVAVVGSETYAESYEHLDAMSRQFGAGELGLFQVLLGKPDRRGRVSVPQTRAGLYLRKPGRQRRGR
jgi:cyclopropane fatty-acyl-phospholipid synthase-like methyltransferase/tryptophan 2,3-dioxygenase